MGEAPKEGTASWVGAKVVDTWLEKSRVGAVARKCEALQFGVEPSAVTLSELGRELNRLNRTAHCCVNR